MLFCCSGGDDLADIVKLVSIPISTPVAFFCFLSVDAMAIITHAEGFTWKASLATSTAHRPVRCLQRSDLLDSKL